MSQSIYNGFGATAFPVSIPDSTELVDALDHGRVAIAGLLRAAINAEVGTLWERVIRHLGPSHYLCRVTQRGQSSIPVMDVMLQEPNPGALQQRHSGWPLLAVYREGNPTTEGHSLYGSIRKQRWSVDWVVGPLDVSDFDRIGMVATKVADVVNYVIDEGWHPAFQNGTRQFYGQFVTIKVVDQQGPGVAQMIGEEKRTGYFGVSLILETGERKIKTDGWTGDVTNQNYPAFATQHDTPLTQIIVDGRVENQTPDPVET